MRNNRVLKSLGVAVTSIALLGGQLTPAYAGMVESTTAIQQAMQQVQRADLNSWLERADVQSKLIEFGVDLAAAKERVAAMTEDEIHRLNQGLGDMPAGGDVLGIILLIFLVFVITDMLGATDVFPFVHNINK